MPKGKVSHIVSTAVALRSIANGIAVPTARTFITNQTIGSKKITYHSTNWFQLYHSTVKFNKNVLRIDALNRVCGFCSNNDSKTSLCQVAYILSCLSSMLYNDTSGQGNIQVCRMTHICVSTSQKANLESFL